MVFTTFLQFSSFELQSHFALVGFRVSVPAFKTLGMQPCLNLQIDESSFAQHELSRCHQTCFSRHASVLFLIMYRKPCGGSADASSGLLLSVFACIFPSP